MNKIELNNINYLKIPFPHCVIDDFFDTNIANELYKNINSLKLKDANLAFTNKKRIYEYNKFVQFLIP
ncbi:hypothetical protein CPAV1605_796 [seawater metagenome]|uniref:Uncharacterized protein n=1 Tax=seawater metagenome TaxID=1561972 RepID=A0A5E8CIM8_9ZZZZ